MHPKIRLAPLWLYLILQLYEDRQSANINSAFS